eukprot:CAMPEP_0185719760 /NCGR_PEP_ID=MMETSP1164-20130828/49448_1 /TAXON_ID=1104430 /ORGANISM="Chrysoreinhardia sp, Strain CCMP2950" /LENGTH=111 /DNA_ID=CAMNT_0028387421 /DNA_START=68 /DNA_END=400 /DNA_ORIENTATION=+
MVEQRHPNASKEAAATRANEPAPTVAEETSIETGIGTTPPMTARGGETVAMMLETIPEREGVTRPAPLGMTTPPVQLANAKMTAQDSRVGGNLVPSITGRSRNAGGQGAEG